MLECFGDSDRGCVRQNNEDCFLQEPELGLFLVADGMGGAQAGEHASRLATQYVADWVRRAPHRDAKTLEQAIQGANLAIMDAAARKAELEGMGTTIVAALEIEPSPRKDSHEIYVASVGDSRAYLCDREGVTLVTEDQTWVNEVGRKLGLDDEKLKAHPMRHVLTMAVGVSHPLVVKEYPPRVMEPGMQLLLCSDGLHGIVPMSVISEVLQNDARTLQAKCRFLIDSAKEAGGPDNITVLLLRVG